MQKKKSQPINILTDFTDAYHVDQALARLDLLFDTAMVSEDASELDRKDIANLLFFYRMMQQLIPAIYEISSPLEKLLQSPKHKEDE